MLRGTMQGQQQGQQALAGVMPSAQQPGGAPPNDIDPASPAFKAASGSLNRLCDVLKQLRDDVNYNQCLKLEYELNQLQLSRRKEILKQHTDQMSAGGGAVSAARGINAMGVPGGM